MGASFYTSMEKCQKVQTRAAVSHQRLLVSHRLSAVDDKGHLESRHLLCKEGAGILLLQPAWALRGLRLRVPKAYLIRSRRGF